MGTVVMTRTCLPGRSKLASCDRDFFCMTRILRGYGRIMGKIE